jgi:hypothetical protein
MGSRVKITWIGAKYGKGVNIPWIVGLNYHD